MGIGRVACGLAVCALWFSACAREPEKPPTPDEIHGRGGMARWIDVPDGRLKVETYATARLSQRPVLVAVLHGDRFDPMPGYHYAFAQALVQGFDAPALPGRVRARFSGPPAVDDVIAAGLLRPGYVDSGGDRSDGERGDAAGDNYTPEVTDGVAQAVRDLKMSVRARHVVLVGHSGGAAIAANVLGRYPGLADAALLVACGCDPEAWRARMRQSSSHPMWRGETRSLLPLDLAEGVRRGVVVRLVVGQQDATALPEYSARYAERLRQRGVDAQVTVVPGVGHDIMFEPAVFSGLEQLLRSLP